MGTGKSALPRRGMPCALPLPPPECPPSSWPRVTSLMEFLRFPWSSPTPCRASLALSRLLSSSGGTRLGLMLPRSTHPPHARWQGKAEEPPSRPEVGSPCHLRPGSGRHQGFQEHSRFDVIQVDNLNLLKL